MRQIAQPAVCPEGDSRKDLRGIWEVRQGTEEAKYRLRVWASHCRGIRSSVPRGLRWAGQHGCRSLERGEVGCLSRLLLSLAGAAPGSISPAHGLP